MESASVSVLMAVYNGLPHLPAAVDSILAQTLQSFELIIVDDGSTDGSSDFLQRLADPRVRVIRQANAGLGASLNRALELVRTPYIARMDADDISRPARLARQLRFAQDQLAVGFFGSGFSFTLDGETSGCAPAMPLTHESIVAALRRGGHAICHPTLFCSTALLRQVGGYRIAGVGQDWDLFLRMSEVARAANLRDELLLYRLHSSSNAWSSAYRTIVAKQYALHCAACRRRHERAPDPEAFFEQWEARGAMRRLAARANAASEVFYRQAIVDRLRGKTLRSMVSLALASAANPGKVLLRAERELRAWVERAERHQD